MIRYVAAFLILVGVCSAQQVRPITQVNDINEVGPDTYHDRQVTWFSGDSIRWDVYARDVRTAIDLTGTTFPVLYVADEDTMTNVYIVTTGTVVSATNGHVRVAVGSTNNVLDPAIDYAAWITVFRVADGATGEVATVAYSAVDVAPSPYGDGYTYISPTNPPFQFTIDGTISAQSWSQYPATQTVNAGNQTITNLTGLADVAWISGGPTISGTVTFASQPVIPGYATGTPVYVETGTGTLIAASIANLISGPEASNQFYLASNPSGYVSEASATGFVKKTGGTMSGNLDMANNSVTGINRLVSYADQNFVIDMDSFNILGNGWQFESKPTIPGYYATTGGTVSGNATISGNLVLTGGLDLRSGTGVGITNVTYIQGRSGANLILDDNRLEGAWEADTIFTANAGLDVFGALRVKDASSNTVATITSTNLKFGTSSFNVNAAGDISQDSTNTAALGVVNVSSINASGLTGAVPASVITASGIATGTPIYSVAGLATGTPIYSVAGLATGTPLYEVDLTPYATGTPIYSVAGLATGTPIYSVAGLATGTPIYSVAGLATGTPLYEVDLSGYATGTPIYTVSGLATGTPLYEIDLSGYATGTPVYSVAGLATGTPIYSLAGYATGTPIYSVAGLATGTPLYEIDLSGYATGTPVYSVSGLATGTPIYSVAGLATGTPLYAYTESDPVWSSASNSYVTTGVLASTLSGYATGTPVYSVSGLATGSPLYEVDLSGYATGTPVYTVSGLATGTPLYVEAGTGTLVAASISDFMAGSDISNTFFSVDNDGAGSGLDADKLDGLQGASYHTLSSFQAYTTNAIKFFAGTVTTGQSVAYGAIWSDQTNAWMGMGGTQVVRWAVTKGAQ